jgi:hypothetical protein
VFAVLTQVAYIRCARLLLRIVSTFAHFVARLRMRVFPYLVLFSVFRLSKRRLTPVFAVLTQARQDKTRKQEAPGRARSRLRQWVRLLRVHPGQDKREAPG